MKRITIFLISFFFSNLLFSQDLNDPNQRSQDQEREKRSLHKKKVREKLYLGASTEGELAIQPGIMTTKEKRKKEKEERENQ